MNAEISTAIENRDVSNTLERSSRILSPIHFWSFAFIALFTRYQQVGDATPSLRLPTHHRHGSRSRSSSRSIGEQMREPQTSHAKCPETDAWNPAPLAQIRLVASLFIVALLQEMYHLLCLVSLFARRSHRPRPGGAQRTLGYGCARQPRPSLCNWTL